MSIGGPPPGDRPASHALTHLDEHGRARMVDVTGKAETLRRAMARCVIIATPDAIEAGAKAEDLFSFAKASGMHAAKQASSLIPLCHPIPLDDVDVQIAPRAASIEVRATTSVVSRTGVEIEALAACAAAALTIVMSLLPGDPDACFTTLALWHKSGGRSGTWQRGEGRSIGAAEGVDRHA